MASLAAVAVLSLTGIQVAGQQVAGAAGYASRTVIATGFNVPFGVAIDGSGNVYVADSGNGQIVKMDSSGNNRTVIATGFSHPYGVAVDGSGNVYVGNSTYDGDSPTYGQIVKMDSSGNNRTVIATGLGSPLVGLAVDGSGHVYVADSFNSKIVKMDSSGNNRTVIATGIGYPFGVAVDGSGNVYVDDLGANQIVKMKDDGTSRTVIATGFDTPYGVAVDGSGNVYVADTNNSQIVKMDSSGNNRTVIATGLYAFGVAVDGSGNVYVTDRANGQIVKLATFVTPTPPSISNLPSSGTPGGSFSPTVSTTGDGSKSVTSSTTSVCTIASGLVSYVGVGTCTLVAHVAAGANYAAADGSTQGFNVSQATPTTPSISNMPSSAVYGGSFTPTVSTTGDGSKSVTSSTTAVCTVNGSTDLVTYGGVGTCTLVAHVAAGTNYAVADGSPQGFNVSQATSSTVITCFGPMTYSGSPLTPCAVAVTGAGGLNTTTTVTFNHNINAGTATADASYAGDANHTGSVATQATFTINPATPTTPVITGVPAGAPVGSSFPVVVSTDSDGTHVVTSSTSTICRVDTSDVVHYLATGTCALTASTLASSNYLSSHGSPQSFVVQITPSLHWTKPKPFTYGTPLSQLQLDAGASVLGLFVYSSPAGTVLSAGSHRMVATFYPWDSTNYASVSIWTTMIVKVASSTTTLALSSSSIAFSAETAETFTVSSHTSTGLPNSGPVNVVAGKVLQCVAVFDSTGTGTCSLNDTQLKPGRYAIKATTVGNSNVKRSLSASQLLTVTG